MMSDEEESGPIRCYLDEKSFFLCCQLFLQHSDVLKDGWSWTNVKGCEEGYMKKTVLIPGRLCTLPNERRQQKTEEDINALVEDKVEEVDDAGNNAVCESPVVLCYEYHVLYSCSYQVPILYFSASTLDGRLLALEDIWNNIHLKYREQLLQGPWDALTQQTKRNFCTTTVPYHPKMVIKYTCKFTVSVIYSSNINFSL
ncbi:ubiquitin-like-conjugating enzyme ATG10 isoform X2 [Hoplias malabaricus]|uniref:ubiquitin-like-conjugating enzyme ATG10 isoform X2 n=1 Tax=Hoplias malabaricus TaxID=27720 RepID=UPI0034624E8A